MLRAGRAVLFLLGLVGYRWLVWPLQLPPLIWLVEIAYEIVARNRPFFARFMFRDE